MRSYTCQHGSAKVPGGGGGARRAAAAACSPSLPRGWGTARSLVEPLRPALAEERVCGALAGATGPAVGRADVPSFCRAALDVPARLCNLRLIHTFQEDSSCQICRYGTFNDQPNGSCKNWTKCSANQVLEPGTAAKDVICKHASHNPTLVTTLPTMSPAIPVSITVPGKDLQEDIIRISLTVAGLLCIVFLLPLCICFSIWQKKKLHAVFKKMHITPEQSIQEDDACSCRFPEEEQDPGCLPVKAADYS
ncbi:tumor necrosis factor receptor superfamily member 9 [Athene cunicularia]|uniref:tumor necrosis factor receptor superfamily member 9 n=1 Tax=Athene cunicularia TaxID=194338 RepID=UPI000EF745EA|nr:tumor necrosis factor receptor superfamily member 9 [Athene cunicularia]